MIRLAHAAATLTLILALGACSDATDASDADTDAASEPADTESETTTTPPSEPTDLYIAHVVKSADANSGGCLGSVRTSWKPDPKAEQQRVCGVQNNAEMWFSIDPETAFKATVTEASALIPETSSGGAWVVQITLDDQSAQRFGQMVTKLLSMPTPDQMALIVRGKVVSAPIPTPGLEGLKTLQVAGNFSKAEAEALATSLGAQ